MTREFEVLVVGAGVAGVSAALAAAGRGVAVGVVDGGPGATAMVAGAWRGGVPAGLAEALEGWGWGLVPVTGSLGHPSGGVWRCGRAAAPQAAGVLEDGTLVCGIVGLPGFSARGLAASWGEAAGVALDSAVVEMDGGTPAGGWSPASLAGALEREPARLGAPLARVVRSAGATRVVLPAVLGLGAGGGVAAALEAAIGVPIGEALGVPPSLPGYRLRQALEAALARAGVEVVRRRAVAGREAAGRLVEVMLEGGGIVRARTFVLATGKFAGGGITASGGLREAVLGCPLALGDGAEAPVAWNPLAVTQPERTAEQPLLRVGVRVDGGGRPLDRRGGVRFDNVWAAGAVVAGAETVELGLGGAAESGWRAGERAAEAV